MHVEVRSEGSTVAGRALCRESRDSFWEVPEKNVCEQNFQGSLLDQPSQFRLKPGAVLCYLWESPPHPEQEPATGACDISYGDNGDHCCSGRVWAFGMELSTDVNLVVYFSQPGGCYQPHFTEKKTGAQTVRVWPNSARM